MNMQHITQTHAQTQVTVEADERLGPILPKVVLDGEAQCVAHSKRLIMFTEEGKEGNSRDVQSFQ